MAEEEIEKLIEHGELINSCEAVRKYVKYQVTVCTSASHQIYDSRRKFYVYFHKLLEKIFGETDEGVQIHEAWMSTSAGVATRRSSRRTPFLSKDPIVSSSSNQLTKEGNAIVRVLSSHHEEEGSIFNAIFSQDFPVELKFEISKLPKHVQNCFHPNVTVNLSHLYIHLMSKKMKKQSLDPRNPYMLVTLNEFYLFYFFRYAVLISKQSSKESSNKSQSRSRLTSPAAKYFVSAANALDSTQNSPRISGDSIWSSFVYGGLKELTRGKPYHVLFLEYLNFFGGHSQENTLHNMKQMQCYATPHQSELFLYAIIDFWLLQNVLNYRVHTQLDSLANSRGYGVDYTRNRMPFGNSNTTGDVYSLSDIEINGEYIVPTDNLLRAIFIAIIYFLGDTSLPMELPKLNLGFGYMNGVLADKLCLTSILHTIHKPFYEFLLAGFSRCSLRNSSSSFIGLVDIWLAYLQPWTCKSLLAAAVTSSSSQSSSSKGNSHDLGTLNSNVMEQYEGFILSNYHFYTTLLGTLILKARTMELCIEDNGILQMLERVVHVFDNPYLLGLLKKADGFMTNCCNEVHFSANTRLDEKFLLSPNAGAVLLRHCNILGVNQCPIPLNQFKTSAQCLLDQIAKASGITGRSNDNQSGWLPEQVVGKEMKKQKKARIIAKALRTIFSVPDEYISPVSFPSTINSKDSSVTLEPSRDQQMPRLLSKRGVQQIMQGFRQCTYGEGHFVGDDLTQPVRTYEIPCLVHLACKISNWVNNRIEKYWYTTTYQQDNQQQENHQDDPYRENTFRKRLRNLQMQKKTRIVNLRFIADPANLVFIGLSFIVLYFFTFVVL